MALGYGGQAPALGNGGPPRRFVPRGGNGRGRVSAEKRATAATERGTPRRACNPRRSGPLRDLFDRRPVSPGTERMHLIGGQPHASPEMSVVTPRERHKQAPWMLPSRPVWTISSVMSCPFLCTKNVSLSPALRAASRGSEPGGRPINPLHWLWVGGARVGAAPTMCRPDHAPPEGLAAGFARLGIGLPIG